MEGGDKLIVENYFASMFPNVKIRELNLAKLGYFVKSDQYNVMLILYGPPKSGKTTLFKLVTLMNQYYKSHLNLFENDEIFISQDGNKFICLTQSLDLIKPLPNYKVIIINLVIPIPLPMQLEIIARKRLCHPYIDEILNNAASNWTGYDRVPKYISECERWIDQHLIQTPGQDNSISELYNLYQEHGTKIEKKIFIYTLLSKGFHCQMDTVKNTSLKH